MMRATTKTFTLLSLLLLATMSSIRAQDITLVFFLEENSAVGTLVGTVSATDPDGDPLTYAIVSGNDLGGFTIDQTDGDITVADDAQMDFETTPSFDLMVEADDGNGGMTTASVTINLIDIENENPLSVPEENLVEVFPNPVSDFLTVDLMSSGLSDVKVSMHGLDGRQVKMEVDKRDSKMVINCASLKSGIYFLSVKSNGQLKSVTRVSVQ